MIVKRLGSQETLLRYLFGCGIVYDSVRCQACLTAYLLGICSVQVKWKCSQTSDLELGDDAACGACVCSRRV